MRNLTQALTLTSIATSVRSALKIASVQPLLWWDAESHRAALTSGGATTLFQDSAGTSAVTAVEQPVGRAVDQSGNSRNALQVTSTARPLLTARKNILTHSQDFTDAAGGWAGFGGVARVYDPTVTDPFGGAQATRVTGVNGGYICTPANLAAGLPLAAGAYTYSIYVKQAGKTSVSLWFDATSGGGTFLGIGTFNLTNGTFSTTGGASASVVSLSNGWYRVSITGSIARTTAVNPLLRLNGDANTATGVYAYGAQLEPGSVATTYQRIAAATDYDIAAAPLMLNFDGLDDVLASSFAAGVLPSSADVYIVLQRAPDDGASIFIGDTVALRYIGVADGSDSGTLVAVGAGAATTWVNGAQVTTRSATASATGSSRVLFHAHAANLSAWTGLAIGAGFYTASGYAYKGGIGAVLITHARSDSTRAKIRKDLAKAYQITGVV